MRAKITTTITTEIDLDTMVPEHTITIDDHDGLTEIHPDVTIALVLGGLAASRRTLREQYPRVAAADDRANGENEETD